MDILEKYQEEAAEDVQIDMINVQTLQMILPSKKHKWVARLINARRKLKQLETNRTNLLEDISTQISEKSATSLSNHALKAAASKHASIKTVDQQISEMKLVIEYLERLEKVFSSMTFDFKNIVELIKLETL